MIEYQEKFVINRCTYGIEAVDGGFVCWKGGCSITGALPSITFARETIHNYAVCQNRAEVASGQTMIDNATKALNKLGDDPFNLGGFQS